MLLDTIADFFLPAKMRHNKAHPKYDEFRVIASALPAGIILLSLFPLVLFYLGKPVIGFYINSVLLVCTLFCMKFFGHYRIPLSLTALVTYFIIYSWVKDSGFIYSSNTSIMHMYLLGAIWADKRYGWWSIFANLLVFFFFYHQTITTGVGPRFIAELGTPLYALIMHCLITVFLGGFLAYEQLAQERNREKIRALQDEKINLLDKAVKQRTDQLNNMRHVMAADFHDETGNMLSAITRQASLLKLKLHSNDTALPIAENIIQNSNDLYARSRDFLWNLNHNSDDPLELFNYLTAQGQLFYNQFDIAFSSAVKGRVQQLQQLDAFAALNLIFIFKEAINNVVKHASGSEVVFEMLYGEKMVVYAIQDNGRWKEADESQPHYGVINIERRCEKNNFDFVLLKQQEGTRLEITVPVTIFFN